MKLKLTENDIELSGRVFQSPRVLALAIGLPELVGSLLRWRGTSVRLLSVLVSLLGGETDARQRQSLEISNSELAAYLWPEIQTVDSAKNKCTRWIKQFEEDQRLSGALMVQRRRGAMREDKRTGKKEFLTSRYSVRDFDGLAWEVGGWIKKKNGVVEIRSIVASVLISKFNCAPILPEMRNEEKKRLAEGKKKGQREKRIQQAKNGEIEMDYQEILSLDRPDRIEVLCGQFLMWGDKLLDEVQDYEDLEQLKWIANGMHKKFGAAVAQTLERRYAAERKSLINRSGLKSVA